MGCVYGVGYVWRILIRISLWFMAYISRERIMNNKIYEINQGINGDTCHQWKEVGDWIEYMIHQRGTHRDRKKRD